MLRRIVNRVCSKWKYGLFAASAVIGLSLSAGNASAQWGGYGGYGGYGGGYGGYGGGYGGYGGNYHQPSTHYDAQFHGYSHWGPFRGYHSHGHYDYVPHYTPGHFHH